MLLGGVLMTVWRGLKPQPDSADHVGLSCASAAVGAVVPATLFWAAVAGYFISGMTYSIGNCPLRALLQSSVPNQMLGRSIR